tara:strand:+ start:3034 stop:3705 length:672 start_codon:yes stop_codon:yes gene_type:complete
MDKQKLIGIGLIILCVFLLWNAWSSNAEMQDFKDQVMLFKDKEQVFIETENKRGEKIAEQQQIIMTQKDALDLGLLEIENLKKIKSQVKVVTRTVVDSVFIPFGEVDTSNSGGITFDVISVPKEFSLLDEWYSLSGTVKKNGLFLDTLSFNNKTAITIGMESRGVFKSPRPVVVVKHENPYTYTTKMSNVVIKNKLRFYDKKSFWLGTGVVIGIIIPSVINND